RGSRPGPGDRRCGRGKAGWLFDGTGPRVGAGRRPEANGRVRGRLSSWPPHDGNDEEMGAEPTGQSRWLIEWGVAARTFPGESRSGDMYVVGPFPGGALVAAVDGLRHGDEAAEAAEAAARILAGHPAEPPQPLLRRCQ